MYRLFSGTRAVAVESELLICAGCWEDGIGAGKADSAKHVLIWGTSL